MKTIKVKIGQPEKEEIWRLSRKVYFCPMHGKCKAILDEKTSTEEWEYVRRIGIDPLFFCKKCGMVKGINAYSNSYGLCEAEECDDMQTSIPPSVKTKGILG